MSSSNAGGKYPDFDSADVTIMSQTGKMWKLHHQTLSNNSEMFKELFARSPSTKKSGIRWRLHMIDHPLTGEIDANATCYKDFRSVALKSSGFMPTLWNGMGEEPKFNAIYDNLFRCMYNLNPTFGSTQDGDQSMKEALNLLTAASYAQAYPAVRLVIENHLLQFNQLLWYQVEKNPETWASTACKLQSAVILREAMIHLAGRYHLRGQDSINKKTLEHVEWGISIYELATQKGRELKDYKLQVERRLFEFVPPRMLHPPVQLANGIVTAGRQVYAGDVYWWMCLHLIRQYFSLVVAQNRHHRAEDGGIAFYRTLAAPHAYLLKDSLDAFHEQFCMTPKSRVVFAHGLNELKKDFVSVVEGLLVDHCQAQRGIDATPRVYLTCTVVLDEEMPWVEKLEPPQAPHRIRITDEDEDDIQKGIEVHDSRAAPLPSSNFNSMFISERAQATPANSSLVSNGAVGHLASQGMQNGSFKSATSRRQRNPDIESDGDGSPSPSTKKAKTSPTMPLFPADGRLTSDRAAILSNGIRVGLIGGEKLADINARAEMSAAAGVPNMGGLVSNPRIKPRGGFNHQFSSAITGGCGASSRAWPAGGAEAAKDDEEMDEEEEAEEEEQAVTDQAAVVEDLEFNPRADGASQPASHTSVNGRASQTQASIKPAPNPSLPSKQNDSASASEVPSQQTAGAFTQNTQTSTGHTQISNTTASNVDSSSITKGGRSVVSQTSSRASAASTNARSAPTPLHRPQQYGQTVIAPISQMSSAVAVSETSSDVARAPTPAPPSRTHEGTTPEGSLQQIAREGMRSMVDKNARLREAVPAQLPRMQEGNDEIASARYPTIVYNHVPLPSQSGPRGQSSMGSLVDSDSRFMPSSLPPHLRSSGLEPTSHTSSSRQMGSMQSGPSGALQFVAGTFASNPALGGPSFAGYENRDRMAQAPSVRPHGSGGTYYPQPLMQQSSSRPGSSAGYAAYQSTAAQRDETMAFFNSGPSQQPPRPLGLEQNYYNPRAAYSGGFEHSATPYGGNRSVQRAENSAFQGSSRPNCLVSASSQAGRSINLDEDTASHSSIHSVQGYPQQPRGPSSQAARPGYRDENSTPQNSTTSFILSARLSDKPLPAGVKKKELGTKQMSNSTGTGKGFVPKM